MATDVVRSSKVEMQRRLPGEEKIKLLVES